MKKLRLELDSDISILLEETENKDVYVFKAFDGKSVFYDCKTSDLWETMKDVCSILQFDAAATKTWYPFVVAKKTEGWKAISPDFEDISFEGETLQSLIDDIGVKIDREIYSSRFEHIPTPTKAYDIEERCKILIPVSVGPLWN